MVDRENHFEYSLRRRIIATAILAGSIAACGAQSSEPVTDNDAEYAIDINSVPESISPTTTLEVLPQPTVDKPDVDSTDTTEVEIVDSTIGESFETDPFIPYAFEKFELMGSLRTEGGAIDTSVNRADSWGDQIYAQDDTKHPVVDHTNLQPGGNAVVWNDIKAVDKEGNQILANMPFPGELGLSLIACHRTKAGEDVCRDIDKVNIGEKVNFTYIKNFTDADGVNWIAQRELIFEVVSADVVPSDRKEFANFYNNKNNQNIASIGIYACDYTFEEYDADDSEDEDFRRIVIAELKDEGEEVLTRTDS